VRLARAILLVAILHTGLMASAWGQDTSGQADASRQADSTLQTDTTAVSHSTVEIRTSVPGVRVYADSQYLGATPFPAAGLSEGMHTFHYVPPDADRWLSAAVLETLMVHPGDHLVRTVEFAPLYHIATEPYGATVRRNGIPVGETPVDLQLTPTRDLITVARPGYEEAAVAFTGGERSVHILLHPRIGPGNGAGGPTLADQQLVYLSGERSKSSFPIFLTTGATVLTGAAAAYFKIRADNYYDDYSRTGNQGSLDQVHRLDLASGISLAASELSLVTLAYFLLAR
jgi:hypothetical protein